MSMVINHNLMAVNTSRNLGVSYGNLADSTRKLSSGLRVGTAADDAAGMAVRELMRADIAAFQQGSRNLNDAISMIQTADGACQTLDNIVVRMKELAEQAATGTYSDTQRSLMHKEFTALYDEASRITVGTEFNGQMLLSGDTANDTISTKGGTYVHFGAANSDTDKIHLQISTDSIHDTALTTLDTLNTTSICSMDAAQDVLTDINVVKEEIATFRAELGALQNRLSYSKENVDIMAENLQAAESRISDVDVATEMTEFTRQQILTNAATGMLSQANQLPQMALRLLG